MGAGTCDYTARRIDEMDAVWGGGFRQVRDHLGVTSFGMNVIELPPNSGDAYPEHSHTFNGQEEVYLVLEGSADLVLPDGVVRLDAGETMVRVGATTRRAVRSGPEGTRLLVMGGTPGSPYTPQPNSVIGSPESPDLLAPDAASPMLPGTTQTLTARDRY